MQTFLFEKSVPSLPSTCQPLDSRWHAHALIPAPPTKHPSKRDTRSPWAFEFMWLIHAQAVWDMANKLMTWNSPYSLLLDQGEYSVNRSLNLKHPHGLSGNNPSESYSPSWTWLFPQKSPAFAVSPPPPARIIKIQRLSFIELEPARTHTHTQTHTHAPRVQIHARARMWDAAVEAPRTVNSPTHRSIAHKTTSEPGCCFHWVDRNYRWELICACSKGLQKRDPLIILLTLFRSNM